MGARQFALLISLLPACAAAQGPEKSGGAGLPPIEGRLLFDGKPLSETTTAQARLWFRNEDTNAERTVRGDREVADRFVIKDMPAGRYLITVYVDAEPRNPTGRRGYPGDFYAAQTFEVSAVETLEIPVRRVIHLTSPQDNASLMEGWDEPCEGKPVFTGRVPFAWEPLDLQATYRLSIRRIKCPYEDLGEVLSDVTEKSEVSFALNLSAPREFYLFKLEAVKEGRPLGVLMTHGARGEGWDYRFRVVAPDP